MLVNARVAKLADALDLGSSGQPCRFKSCHAHQILEKQAVLVQTLRNEGFLLIENMLDQLNYEISEFHKPLTFSQTLSFSC